MSTLESHPFTLFSPGSKRFAWQQRWKGELLEHGDCHSSDNVKIISTELTSINSQQKGPISSKGFSSYSSETFKFQLIRDSKS